jgi:hypothetical protein
MSALPPITDVGPHQSQHLAVGFDPKWGAYVLLLNEWPGGVEKFLIDGRTGPVGDRNRQSELTL